MCTLHASIRSDGGANLIGRDSDVEVLRIAELVRAGNGEESDLVKSIRGVTDELPQEDILVLVERVDDDVHQAIHLPVRVKRAKHSQCKSCLLSHQLKRGRDETDEFNTQALRKLDAFTIVKALSSSNNALLHA